MVHIVDVIKTITPVEALVQDLLDVRVGARIFIPLETASRSLRCLFWHGLKLWKTSVSEILIVGTFFRWSVGLVLSSDKGRFFIDEWEDLFETAIRDKKAKFEHKAWNVRGVVVDSGKVRDDGWERKNKGGLDVIL